MSLGQSLFIIAALIAVSAFFSVAEISLAASRRLRLRQMADAGDPRAERVLRMQDQPGPYFTVVQIGLNAIAILGGVVGEGALSPYFSQLMGLLVDEPLASRLGFAASFVTVISLFIVLADLLPKRLGMSAPERAAVRLVGTMETLLRVLGPLVWLFGRATDALFKALGLPAQRDERITSADILAMTEAGARSGQLAEREHEVIANVFELDTRVVTSAMTPREHIAWFQKDDPEATVRARILAEPFSTYPVCAGDLDQLLGYVDAKDLFQRVLNNQPLSPLDEGLLHKVLVVPDRLSLAEVLEQFRQAHEDFAVIVNEYSFVVGVITLNDVMSTVMGGLVDPQDEDWIVQRDAHSWLIDGMTPMADVQRTLDLASLPHEGQYETLAGFLMEMLRRVPKRTDTVQWEGFRFEVIDVDRYRIDQVLVTRHPVDDRPPPSLA
ncbi:hemolysin family protein [Curvibacter sp. RS43]|uniref:hemolysin family protein n=1 Tax=Curvibacter microcysteis TaxID=3026419 RepID=UPI00236237A9|nr:hemolysin family protein [Curvibacter sp. RS43]MDD0810391.1 hemolysin family protein [Curvibacter sp. RS43]